MQKYSCHLHSILHDVYGRLYYQYKTIRVYNYMLNAPNFMKKPSFRDLVTGLLFGIYYNIRYHSSIQT